MNIIESAVVESGVTNQRREIIVAIRMFGDQETNITKSGVIKNICITRLSETRLMGFAYYPIDNIIANYEKTNSNSTFTQVAQNSDFVTQ